MSDQPSFEKILASSLGNELTLREGQVLADIMSVHCLNDGERLVAEGEDNDSLFLLAEGKLNVISNINGQDVPVYAMQIGECAGTRAFVDRTPRKATLQAEGKATVYALAPDAFEALLEKEPHIVYQVMRALFRITHANLMRMNQETQQLSNYINKSHGRY